MAPTYIGDETGDECPSSASGQDDDASDQGSIVEPPPLRKALRQNTKGPEATKASSKASVSVSSTRATNSKSVKAQESGSKSAASGEQRMSAVDVLKKKELEDSCNSVLKHKDFQPKSSLAAKVRANAEAITKFGLEHPEVLSVPEHELPDEGTNAPEKLASMFQSKVDALTVFLESLPPKKSSQLQSEEKVGGPETRSQHDPEVPCRVHRSAGVRH